MYFEKILEFVKAVDAKENLTRKEKENAINEIEELFLEVANISDTIIDVKSGVEKGYSQEEYTAKINSAISSAKKLDEIYREEFGIKLLKEPPETSVDIYNLSREFCNDIRRIAIDE